jgi:hypothetical protein
MLELVRIIWEITKPRGRRSSATRSEQRRRPCRPCSDQGRRRSATPIPLAAIRGAPLPVEQPFPPPPLVAATAPPCLPSLSRHEPPPWPPFEPPDTAPSSAPMPGCPSTSLPVPSAAPLLHHHRSQLLSLHRHGTPRSGEPSPLFGHQTRPPPYQRALRPLLHHHRPAAGRPDFADKSLVPTGEKASPISSRA